MGEGEKYTPPEAESFEAGVEKEQTIETEPKMGPLDAVMVFGIGPVQPAGIPAHEGKVHAYQLVPEAKLNAIAAATLYLEGKTRKIIFSGGKTGKMDLGKDAEGKDRSHPYLQSEGEQMAKYVMAKFGIPAEAIVIEDKAANTIENIARSLTPIHQESGKFARLGFLGSAHHTKRIEKMARLFGLEGSTMSSAEVIDRSRAEAGGRPRDQRVHNRMERYRKYFEATLDPDKNPTYKKRLVEEERWSEGLERPAYFLPQLRFIEDPEKLLSVLKMDKLANYLQKERGIDVNEIDPKQVDQMEELRKVLGEITRDVPGAEFEQMPDELPEWRYDRTEPTSTRAELGRIGKIEREAVVGVSVPPFVGEYRSEIENPIERLRNAQLVLFCDIDGTLKGDGDEFTGRYIQMAERCFGAVILTSSRSKGSILEVKNDFSVNELSPVIFENGGAVIFPCALIDEPQINQVAEKVGVKIFSIKNDGKFFTIELSPPKEALKETFDRIAGEVGVSPKFIMDITVEELMGTSHCSRTDAEKELYDPLMRKYFMHNMVFKDEDSEKIPELKRKATEAGLHLTRAKLTWHLSSSGVHKGQAVSFTSELMKMASGQYKASVAFGDAPNDLEMFEKCDYAYMVGSDDGMVLPPHVKSTVNAGPMGVAEGFKELFVKKE